MNISVHSLDIILHGQSLFNLLSHGVSIGSALDSKPHQQPTRLEEQQMAALIQLINQPVKLHLWISAQDTVCGEKGFH